MHLDTDWISGGSRAGGGGGGGGALCLWMKVKSCCHADVATPASAPKNSTAQQRSPRCRLAASSKVDPLKRSKIQERDGSLAGVGP